MAKRLTFEELVGKEFRWPQDGDDSFDVHDDDVNHANIAGDDFSRFVLMSEGYRRSADSLVDIALTYWREKDVLIYPILFLYRLAKQLNLKYIIDVYGHHVGVGPMWNTHDFRVLWLHFL